VEMMDGESMDRNGMSIFVLIFPFMFLRVFRTCTSHTLSCIDVGYCILFWILAQLGDNCAGRREICGKDYGHKRVWDFVSETGLRPKSNPELYV
jgi:hypothetical protein